MFKRGEAFTAPESIMTYEVYESQIKLQSITPPKVYVLSLRVWHYCLRHILVHASLADLNSAVRAKTGQPSQNLIVRARAKSYAEGYNQARKDLRSNHGREK